MRNRPFSAHISEYMRLYLHRRSFKIPHFVETLDKGKEILCFHMDGIAYVQTKLINDELCPLTVGVISRILFWLE